MVARKDSLRKGKGLHTCIHLPTAHTLREHCVRSGLRLNGDEYSSIESLHQKVGNPIHKTMEMSQVVPTSGRTKNEDPSV
jgi:hypothetical protein